MLVSHRSKFAVAPMMDWTDRHCRFFHRGLTKRALLYTEMVTAEAVIDLVVDEMRGIKREPITGAELRRSKDHLKGSLMLSLESTSSRMTHLARQDIYFDRHDTLDETLANIEAVTEDDVQRVAAHLFSNGSLGVTVLGPDSEGLSLPPDRLDLA